MKRGGFLAPDQPPYLSRWEAAGIFIVYFAMAILALALK